MSSPLTLATAVPGDAELTRLRDRLREHALFHDRAGTAPLLGLDLVHAAGIPTLTAGKRYGGAQIGLAETVRILGALGAGDPAVALITSMTMSAHGRQAATGIWPEELYGTVLARSIERSSPINALRVEPALGSPARGGLPATIAHRTIDGWVLGGRKTFCTGSTALAYHLVWARTDEPEPRVGTFVVPGNAPGIEIVETWDHLGLRASVSHDVVYRSVHVGADDVLELVEPQKALQDNVAAAAFGLSIAAIYLGVARSAQQALHAFAWDRVPTTLGRPIADTDRIRAVAGKVEMDLITGEQLVETTARRLEEGSPSRRLLTQALAVKSIATNRAIGAVQTIVAALGNPALTRSLPLERHLRDVLCARVHAPQDDTIADILGRASLDRDLPAEVTTPFRD
ncbi:acyl-CoA/acyl-ACP dehydrogenase [Rhodococcus rhodochrous]|uniref:acyl-CoA dehydrogenase family protein n=1 Tax=Rhodococcus rhodochrous TaxID=1829 RepID=UPI001E5FCD62|nr:acyl-CoA dehydrogenase family protein [Rhodococcus rhodochrous]MCB8913396.1 acyl-CoA/acyl-ACP dehydrogenase [Rhodococcus rhodochrous]